MDKELISFDIKTGMKNIIGRDLITDDFIAIYELVKNSYDAYADYVTITFNDDEIIIADNGKGMSEVDIKEKWLAVAYSAKKDGSEDDDDDVKRYSHLNKLKLRRYYAGAKGVGRFSCDRLGSKLELITTHLSSENTYKIEIDWSVFESDPKQSFNSIEIPFYRIDTIPSYNNSKNHGTILKISNLNSQWTEKRILDLKHSLEKVINPFSEAENEFKIEIIAERHTVADWGKEPYYQINGIIQNSILSVLKIKTTEINLVVNNDKIITKITDRGSLIYHIEESNPFSNLIDKLEIGLYFLNRSAKINFVKIMGLPVINYGSVFLFKNGFRVQPYGEVGDDSWKIDQRKQQGYNRFLGTRDLFGNVNLISDNIEEFKEVSSRDGGLVETTGKKILFDLFMEKALKRLERYVVGVLWGEAFARKNYFLDFSIAQKYRDKLTGDKDKDSYEDIKENLGSKIDFVNLIKSLSDENVEIIDYNKELVNLVNERLDVIQPKFISELEKIAEKTNDTELFNQIKLTEDNFNRILQEKVEALKRVEFEEQQRKEAEKRAKDEELKRIEAEKRQREEEEKRRRAELETERKEKERALAELAKLKAEQKAKEEKEKNKDLTDKLSLETKKNQYLNATRKTLSDDAEQLVHSIDLYVGNASTYVNELMTSNIDEQIKSKVYSIKSNIDKAIKVSQIIIKSNFDYKYTDQRVNLPKYISEYLEDLEISHKNLKIDTIGLFDKFVLINPIEIDIIFDNLVSNSKKAQAKNILVEFSKNQNALEILYSDDGSGMSELLTKNPDAIFDLGVRDSKEKGSGIGMFDVSKRLKGLKGSITFVGNNKKLKGVCFKIKI
ncbi:MAG: ATP-binding protein [Paludibacter sp.]|jgi:signal transduction histidine kinase|nr:ATP-binding protein [Paludibacter sp.]